MKLIVKMAVYFVVLFFVETSINGSVLDGALPHCSETFPTDFGSKSTRPVWRRSRNHNTGTIVVPSYFSALRYYTYCSYVRSINHTLQP